MKRKIIAAVVLLFLVSEAILFNDGNLDDLEVAFKELKYMQAHNICNDKQFAEHPQLRYGPRMLKGYYNNRVVKAANSTPLFPFIGGWREKLAAQRIMKELGSDYEHQLDALIEAWGKPVSCPSCAGRGYRSGGKSSCPRCKGRGDYICDFEGEWGTYGIFGSGKEGDTYCERGRVRAEEGQYYGRCERCGGKGRVDCGRCNGYGSVTSKSTCRICDGDGKIND